MGGRGMTTEITTKQAAKIYAALQPTLGFLTQLEVRLGELGLSPIDPYLRQVQAVRDVFHGLVVETHYRSCEGGVGRATNAGRREAELSPAEPVRSRGRIGEGAS